MKRTIAFVALVAVMTLGVISFGRVASAEEIKMVGTITKLVVSGNSATVTLKDNKSGKNVVITVTDDLTLDKFKDHRIVEGDEIRCKYDTAEGKNKSSLFRKTAGC